MIGQMMPVGLNAIVNGRGALSVLVAEDDGVFRTVLRTFLERWGYKVTLVKDGAAAWREMQVEPRPRLLLLDWVMPGIEGVEICRRLRAEPNEMYSYIIVVTSKDEKSDVIQALNAGADDYITKPFDPEELRARMQVGTRILTLQDELLRSREELRRQASQDSLTGLKNRRSIIDSLAKEMSRGKRTGAPLGVLMLDLDNFKTVNDTHGHLTGDAVLAEVAGRIVSVVRSYDAVGRYGGEEFLIVLSDCNAGLLDSVAERIRERIAAKPVITVGGDIDMTASIGGMIVDPGLTMEAETAIHRADVALYRAKNLGRNCCVFETSSIRPQYPRVEAIQ